METSESKVFLNLVVQKIDPSNIQEFMRSWLKQVCKDFRIVFIDKDLSKDQAQALDYAVKFAEALEVESNVAVVDDENSIPSAKSTKILKDTSELPCDKLEVLKLRSNFKETSIAKEKNAKLIDEVKSAKPQTPAGQPISNQEKPSMLVAAKPKKDVLVAKDKVVEKVFFKIIIPNYNNMPYVKKCLDSILEQTFQDFKIIVVDDLSTDGSDKFCEMYARKYPSKIVFQQLKTKGYAGACRNVGLDYKLESTYSWFIDSDDWLYDKNVLKQIFNTIKINNYPDIVRCSLKHLYANNITKLDILGTSLQNIFYSGAGPCKNCIKSSITARFQENRAKLNDVMWLLRVIDQVNPKKIIATKYPCQIYNRISITSCQNASDIFSMPQCIIAKRQLLNDLQNETFKTMACQKEKSRLIQQIGTSMKNTIIIKDLLMNSFAISIDSAKYKLFTQIFKASKLEPIPKLSVGCMDQSIKPFQRCTRSHIELVKNAKANNKPYILIFEDDAYPCIDCAKKLEAYLTCIPKDASMVILGWSACQKKLQKFDQVFNKVTTWTISGSHAYILFKNGYDSYLKFFSNNKEGRADNNIYQAVGNAYILSQPLFIQYSETKSMNNHLGYIFYGDHKTPPNGFKTINEVLNNA